IEKSWINVAGQQCQRHDANGVFQNHYEQTHQHQNNLSPKGTQIEVRDQDGKNDKRQTRTDAAALASDFDIDAREVKNEALTEDRDTASVKQYSGNLGGPFLQEVNGPIEKEIRNRNGEEQKREGKGRTAKSDAPETECETGNPEKNQCKDAN